MNESSFHSLHLIGGYFTFRVSVVPAGPSVPLDLWRDSTSMPLENWSHSLNRISWTVLVSHSSLLPPPPPTDGTIYMYMCIYV